MIGLVQGKQILDQPWRAVYVPPPLPSILDTLSFPIKWCNRTFVLFFFEKGRVILFSGLCAIDPLQSVSGKNETFFSYGINKKKNHTIIVVVVEKIENI